MSRGTELERLHHTLRRTRWWAILATLASLGLGAMACLLGGWLLALVQTNPQLFALATPVWPTMPGSYYGYLTPTPYYGRNYPPPYSGGSPLPTLIVYPAGTPENAITLDVGGSGEFTMQPQDTWRSVLQPTYAVAPQAVTQLSVFLYPSDPNVSPPLEMRIWNRAYNLWDLYTPVWGENYIYSPEYYVGPVGEVFIEFTHYGPNPVTISNLSLQMVLLGRDGFLFYVPFGASPTPIPMPTSAVPPTPFDMMPTDAATPTP